MFKCVSVTLSFAWLRSCRMRSKPSMSLKTGLQVLCLVDVFFFFRRCSFRYSSTFTYTPERTTHNFTPLTAHHRSHLSNNHHPASHKSTLFTVISAPVKSAPVQSVFLIFELISSPLIELS